MNRYAFANCIIVKKILNIKPDIQNLLILANSVAQRSIDAYA